MADDNIPHGYWQDANGSLIPVGKIKPIDKDRHKTVVALCEDAKKQRATLAAFKADAMKKVIDFVDRSLAEYDVATGGKKGNVTLTSFDGRYKVVRQMQETLVFDERLQAAKVLVDECIHAWSKGANGGLRLLVNDAFQVDKAGAINAQRVLGLRRHNIPDEKWKRAMDAISDSVMVASSKPHVRFYERDERGQYVGIPLDIAAI